MADTALRLAATGQTIRHDWLSRRYWVKPGALLHLTDGTPYSRTGRNVMALCGVSVRPEPVESPVDCRVCPKCKAARVAPSGAEHFVDEVPVGRKGT